MNDDARVTLVTGASSGIGRAVAVRAARNGDHLALLARAEGPLEDTAEECRAAGAASARALPCDVGDDAAVAACVREVLTQHARIDAVVNAAGVVAYGRTEEIPEGVFTGVLRTNLLGSVNVARHVLPVFRRQRAGSLVLVGSVLGHVAVPTMSPYVVSKWGVRALARQLALENRDIPGISVREVAPGGVDTPIYDQGANYLGHGGQPPPPAASAERTAGQVLRRLAPPPLVPLPTQLSVFNHGLLFGFGLLPRVYDALIGRAFPLGALDLTEDVGATAGNVLDPGPREEHRADGAHGSTALGVLRNALVAARRAVEG